MCLFLLRTNKHVKQYSWKWWWSWPCCNSNHSSSDSYGITSNFDNKSSKAFGGSEYCNDIQFRKFQSASYYSRIADDTITIETSQGKYSVKIDKALNSGDELVWFKNVGAKDPRGRVLLP